MNSKSEYYRAWIAAMSPEELERERAYQRMRAKVYRETHRDEINAKQREKRANMTEEERTATRARDRAHYAQHREKRLAASKAYNAKNADKIKAYKRERYASNPEVREQKKARPLAYYYNVVKPKRQAASVAKANERLTAMGYTVIRPTEEGNA